MFWLCCNSELWGFIFLGSVLLSLAAPILLVCLSKEAAGRITIWALRILVPTLVVSLISLAAQGDHGFLSNSQGVLSGCVFLILSVGLGYLLASLRHALSRRGLRPFRGAKVEPESRDDDLS
jgi:hypothetical protein